MIHLSSHFFISPYRDHPSTSNPRTISRSVRRSPFDKGADSRGNARTFPRYGDLGSVPPVAGASYPGLAQVVVQDIVPDQSRQTPFSPWPFGNSRNVTDGLHRRWTENKQT